MITFKKLDEVNSNFFKVCNSCLANSNDIVIYELFVGFNNTGGQLVHLCKKCAKELKETIKLR